MRTQSCNPSAAPARPGPRHPVQAACASRTRATRYPWRQRSARNPACGHRLGARPRGIESSAPSPKPISIPGIVRLWTGLGAHTNKHSGYRPGLGPGTTLCAKSTIQTGYNPFDSRYARVQRRDNAQYPHYSPGRNPALTSNPRPSVSGFPRVCAVSVGTRGMVERAPD